MKIFKRILFIFLLLAILLGSALIIYLQTTKPVYAGKLPLKGLSQPVETYFDTYGIPHIYGQTEEDVYRTLGYLHAQDRLFQMEMLRRVSSGRLSEILGSGLLDVDRFFRMLGIAQHAEAAAKKIEGQPELACNKAALAYLDGVNQFLENGSTPVEFHLIGIPKEKFTVKDLCLIVDFMSFNFEMGFRTDPLMSRIRKKMGDGYLHDLSLGYVPGSPREPVYFWDKTTHPDSMQPTATIESVTSLLPVKVWMGSNAWVVSAKRSENGKVLFANDTHIGHQQPAVWYEAHLEYPGFRFYGNFLAGFPFAPLGHTPHHAWGLTIFENDDLDFYIEKTDSLHPNQIWFKDHWEQLTLREETIHVKDSADVLIQCRASHHGPVCSDVMSDFKDITSAPVTACWTLLREPSELLKITYDLAHAASIHEFRKAVTHISAPGLNVLYADSEDNIAWWTAAKIVKRPAHVQPSLLLDGSTGADDWMGYYDFSENPQAENPPWGYVYSTNNQPDSVNHILYPGYYLPRDRSLRVTEFLQSKKKFELNDMLALNTDVTNPVAVNNVKELLSALHPDTANRTDLNKDVVAILKNWNGSHQLDDCGPTIYYRWLYHVLYDAFADEMGDKDFDAFQKTHVEKCSVEPFLRLASSAWWDNSTTTDRKESKQDIISNAFHTTVQELSEALGPVPSKWHWSRIHTIELEHPLGKQKPLNKIFNIGPFPEMGGIETVNNQSFNLTKEIWCKANVGPALRRVIDFSNPENGQSINPSGQSGNFMSRHYDDQAPLYVKGEARKEMMNKAEIIKTCKDKLIFEPEQK